MPLIKGWQSFFSVPSAENQNSWLREFSDGNVGLLLGTDIGDGYRLGALDVDDERFVSLVKQLAGRPIVAKRGAKGITVFVRYKADLKLKSTNFRSHDNKQIIDILLGGRQTVVPPSIHPSGKEYVWLGQSLLDIDLLTLPELEA